MRPSFSSILITSLLSVVNVRLPISLITANSSFSLIALGMNSMGSIESKE